MTSGAIRPPAPSLEILLADDDSVFCRLVSMRLTRAGHRVTTAANGQEGLDALARSRFDVVLTDWMMPVLDGIELVRHIHAMPAPRPMTVVVTALDLPDARVHALGSGADEFLPKPVPLAQLVDLVERYARSAPRDPGGDTRAHPRPLLPAARPGTEVAVIVGSTGGPAALQKLVSALPADLAIPVIIVQHIVPSFVAALAQQLGSAAAVPVRLVEAGQRLGPEQVWLAPGGQHTLVTCRDEGLFLQLSDDPPVQSCRPSADVLLRSIVRCCGERSLAVLLTGMGNDGVAGARAVHEAGGEVLAQNRATSVVWTTAGAVVDAGLASEVLPIDRVAQAIVDRAGPGRGASRPAGAPVLAGM